MFLDVEASLASTLVGHTLRFPLCRFLWTITERSGTMGCRMFSESYMLQLSDFDFQSEFFQRVHCLRIFRVCELVLVGGSDQSQLQGGGATFEQK